MKFYERFLKAATTPHPGPAPEAITIPRPQRALVLAYKFWLLPPGGEPISTHDVLADERFDTRAWGDAAGAHKGGLALARDKKRRLLRTDDNYVRCADALKKAGAATGVVAQLLGLTEGENLVSALRRAGEEQQEKRQALLASPHPGPAASAEQPGEEPADAGSDDVIEAEAVASEGEG